MAEKSKETTEYEASISRGWLFIAWIIVSILLVWLLYPSGKSSDGGTSTLTITVQSAATPVIHTLNLTTDWSMPIYLPDPLVKLVDFTCDIEEYGVSYDMLVNGKYLYGPTVKDQRVPVKEIGRFIQLRVSAESPIKTGTMRYTIAPPNTAH